MMTCGWVDGCNNIIKYIWSLNVVSSNQLYNVFSFRLTIFLVWCLALYIIYHYFYILHEFTVV